MKKIITVRCHNPYFRGILHGVQFSQATGGASGMATEAQAAKIAEEDNFYIGAVPEEAPEETASEGAETTPNSGNAPTDEESDPGLEDVSGIGPKTAEALREAGIATLADLADASTADLAERGITTLEIAEDWRKQAVDILGAPLATGGDGDE